MTLIEAKKFLGKEVWYWSSREHYPQRSTLNKILIYLGASGQIFEEGQVGEYSTSKSLEKLKATESEAWLEGAKQLQELSESCNKRASDLVRK